MIDVITEQIVTLAQLARRLPFRRSDRPVHPATVHRWRRPGLRGVRLECVRIGGIWHTSLEAYARWVERLTASEQQADALPVQARPSLRDIAQDETTEKQLDELGI
jgi:hypothetical protein